MIKNSLESILINRKNGICLAIEGDTLRQLTEAEAGVLLVEVIKADKFKELETVGNVRIVRLKLNEIEPNVSIETRRGEIKYTIGGNTISTDLFLYAEDAGSKDFIETVEKLFKRWWETDKVKVTWGKSYNGVVIIDGTLPFEVMLYFE